MSALIYVVDDEPTVCDVTRRMLERAGYTVQTMRTSAAATAALCAQRADLVLLDVALPDGGCSGSLPAIEKRSSDRAGANRDR